MVITEQGQNYCSPAVTVTAADLQLKMTQSGQTVTLTCSTSCSLTFKPDYYYWYKNSVYIHRYTHYSMPKPLVLSSRADAGSYSCAVSDRSTLKSSAVDVFKEDSEMNVSYTDRQIDAVEGLSVDFLCTYSHPKAERVNKAFWFYFRPEVESEELSEEEQFAGRVEFNGDKERNCTLRLRDVRERDSGEYRFQFSTQSGETFTGSPGVTLKVTGAEDPEQRSVLTLVTVGVVVFLAIILITAVPWMCCVIRRKRGAERNTDIQTPDPADHTYTALNPKYRTSDYDTLQPLTDSPSDTYTALNPETMSSDYDTLTGVKVSHSELQRRAPAIDYENLQRPSP
ncbi:hypothetical protein MHYP_G00299980 [Metynnis hypsauchen]